MDIEVFKSRFRNEDEYNLFCQAALVINEVITNNEKFLERMEAFDVRYDAIEAFCQPQQMLTGISRERLELIISAREKIEAQYERMYRIIASVFPQWENIRKHQDFLEETINGNGPIGSITEKLEEQIKNANEIRQKVPQIEKAFNIVLQLTEDAEKEVRKEVN